MSQRGVEDATETSNHPGSDEWQRQRFDSFVDHCREPCKEHCRSLIALRGSLRARWQADTCCSWHVNWPASLALPATNSSQSASCPWLSKASRTHSSKPSYHDNSMTMQHRSRHGQALSRIWDDNATLCANWIPWGMRKCLDTMILIYCILCRGAECH